MDTNAFLRKILPSQGIVVIAEPVRKAGSTQTFWKHYKYPTVEEAATAAATFNQAGRTVYHACSTFKEDLPKKFRTQDNAGWAKALWVDADVEAGNPAKYSSKREAMQDVLRVCKELRLCAPTVVDSGGGLHLYWSLTEDVTTAVWTPLAQQFKDRLTALGFKQDPSRTADSASVLRPAGTHNRKTDPPRLVKVVVEGKDITLEQFAAALGTNVPAPIMAMPEEDDDLGGGIEYPPSSADRIIQFCPTLAHVAALQGNVSEPLWHKMIGVVKHTTEGVLRCHEWSVGHPEYSEYETQQKIDNWATGPSTCTSIRQVMENKCEGCIQTCKSPVQLGYTDEAPVPPAYVEQPANVGFTTGAPLTVVSNKPWPKGFKVENGMLCRAVKDNNKDDAPYSWIPFCKTLFFPTERVRTEAGVWALRMEMITYHKTRRNFMLPTQFLVEPQSLVSELAKNEVIIFGRNGKDHVMSYLQEFLQGINAAGPEVITNSAFGWTDDGQGFILGGETVTATTVQPSLCSANIAKLGLNTGFGVGGSRDEWVSLVDRIYNRVGAEPLQFVFCVALASPLISIAGISGFHGIPVAITGTGGLGKSTVCKVACSAFGHMNSMFVDASKAGNTFNALMTRAGIFRHVPLLFDEVTKRTKEEMTDMLFSLSNGVSKTRITANGQIAGDLQPWDFFSFLTGNDDITALLAAQDRATAGATQMRCFEIPLPSGYCDVLFAGTDVRKLVDTQLQECYGHVGREYIRYVMKHRKQVRDMIFKLRAQFPAQDSDMTRERFYMDTVILALAAGTIAQKLGILRFDLKLLLRWALKHIKTLRVLRKATHNTDEEYVAAMLASLNGRTLVTTTLPETRGGRYTPEAPLEIMRDVVAARNVTKGRRFFLSAKYTNEWARDNGITHMALVDTMDKMGLIKHQAKADKQGIFFFNLAQGSTISSAKSRCFELNYDILVGMDADLTTDATPNVVPMRTA